MTNLWLFIFRHLDTLVDLVDSDGLVCAEGCLTGFDSARHRPIPPEFVWRYVQQLKCEDSTLGHCQDYVLSDGMNIFFKYFIFLKLHVPVV